MIILSKQFTREKSLFYFFMWNDSDRLGFSRWIGYKIKNNLFLKNGKENKMSVWYEKKELIKMLNLVTSKISSNKLLVKQFRQNAGKEWENLKPFVEGKKEIKNISTFKKYYKNLVDWWSVMTIIWYIPNLKQISSQVRRESIKMRADSERYSVRFNDIFEDYFNKYFPEYKKFVHVISPEEVFLLEKRKFSKIEIESFKKRLDGFYVLNGKIYLLTKLGEALADKNIKLEDEVIKLQNKIKGIAAFHGFTKGKVRIILNKKSMENFKNNEILVTEMTAPNYILAMKKSAAIITDEGGITSHAAIVARELKKPCIIGTKIATKVLKDGDLVEVDANRGIVKIIKKA